MRMLLPLLLLAAAAVQAQPTDDLRTFTDTESRQVRAAVVRATDSEVWIRRDDGRTFRISLTRFSEKDQKFVLDWRRSQALMAPNAVEIAARRFPDGPRRTQHSESHTVIEERFGYVVTITNRSPYELADLTVEYRFFIREGELGATGQNRSVRHHDGNGKIESIPSRGTAEIKTTAATLTASRLKPGWAYRNTNQRNTKDDLRGICVRVREKGKVIAEFSQPGNLMETEKW